MDFQVEKSGMGKKFLAMRRFFSSEGRNVYEGFAWNTSDVVITDDKGKPLFTQKNSEFPAVWTELTRRIVASRYFYGQQGTPEREYSAKQLVSRVAETMGKWGLKQEYFSNESQAKIFAEELAHLCLSQSMAFNSPVWFNVGIEKYLPVSRKREKRDMFVINETGEVVDIPAGGEYQWPQTAACFIQQVDDNMSSIMKLAVNEARLFKHGSGTGTDLSTLRSARERISGGGKPSGPMAYLQFYDRVAGIVKSGGKTRRAAKMNSLRTEHPDIKEFITAKTTEKQKAEMLMDAGVDKDLAVETVAYQNVNLSVRISDAFMRAVENNDDWQTIPVHSMELALEMPKYKAKEMMKWICEGTHYCGDPGMQFHDIINTWHTCPNSAPINASNPCSEYLFVNNSACNLASLNLRKFIDEGGNFLIREFLESVRVTAIAQDLEIDNSSYPIPEIAENAHSFRPLGMGYANLGSLLMYLGLAYDSDEGRAIAATITALQTGQVYLTSTEMAEKIGTFKWYDKNREPMLKVMRMHRDAINKIEENKLPHGWNVVLDEAKMVWNRVIERGELYGFRNAQATVLAPTGTIGFMMGCDTTGIEPDFSLVKYKLLAGGGTLKILNETVEVALHRLGYNKDEISKIMDNLDKKGTVEGSILRNEHLSVFDCAAKSGDGTRYISYQGHLKMMAAVQPFISGAISKTVNLPENVTTEEIEKVYVEAWKMGLKAVALYRDGSSRLQPLSTKKKDVEKQKEIVSTPTRRKLPITRNSITHKFNLVGYEGYIVVGLYEDGVPGELFVNMSKEGSTIGGLMDAFATSVSFNLQYGVPIKDIIKKFKQQRFEPHGMVYEGHPEIRTASSIVDYIGQFLEKEFLSGQRLPIIEGKQEKIFEESLKKTDSSLPKQKTLEHFDDEKEEGGDELGGFCPKCGTQMIKKGHCNEICPSCKHVSQSGCGG